MQEAERDSAAARHVPIKFLGGGAELMLSLDGPWEYCEAPAGSAVRPDALQDRDWRQTLVPGSIAAAMAGGPESDASPADDKDFIFRKRFAFSGSKGSPGVIVFEGIATLAEVWLNGKPVLRTRNMFRCHVAQTDGLLESGNELVVHVRSLKTALDAKRPPGRWVARMVRNRNLRFVRTSLLGRTKGWGGSRPVTGLWRSVRLFANPGLHLERLQIVPSWKAGAGEIELTLSGWVSNGDAPSKVLLRVGDLEMPVSTRVEGKSFGAHAILRIPGVRAWWPHNLGTPHRYKTTLAAERGGETLHLGTEMLGFRAVERVGADASADEGFALRVNGQSVFCRGACWTPTDLSAGSGGAEEVESVLRLLRDAGFNMVRVSGAMVYESDHFYETCDELGIMVWQDFMFARMDYPEQEPAFLEEVRTEAEGMLARTHLRACMTVYCGNSEVEQQAAMLGMAPYDGRTPLFAQTLAQLVQRWAPGLPYLSSSPTGGVLPFHVNAGVAHYFGVGAYRRPVADARDSGVRFASECLGFSNVPDYDGLDAAEVAGSTRSKQGVPSDTGASWDFGDVTDHYARELFGQDVRHLRDSDPARYVTLTRPVPGEWMAATMGLWRSTSSPCAGALIWFSKDLEPGAGWGLLDSRGRPKASYWALRRVCAPRAIWFTDEGLNGLHLEVANDPDSSFEGRIRIRLVQAAGIPIAEAEREIRLPAHGQLALPVDALLNRFTDSAWTYRFGPAQHVIAIAELVDGAGGVISTAHHVPGGVGHWAPEDIGLRAIARRVSPGQVSLEIATDELALFVRISAGKDWLPADNYFHLPPRQGRTILLEGPPREMLRIQISALNTPSPIQVDPSP